MVQFGNILCLSFESFGELHFRPTFDAWAVRRCIAIVRTIQADCLASSGEAINCCGAILLDHGVGTFYWTKMKTPSKKNNLFSTAREYGCNCGHPCSWAEFVARAMSGVR